MDDERLLHMVSLCRDLRGFAGKGIAGTCDLLDAKLGTPAQDWIVGSAVTQ